jgi:hypothetical protein
MWRYLVTVLLILAGILPAVAQVPPYVYNIALGTSSVQILAVDTLRKRLIFINPNASASVAVCPAGPDRKTGLAITAAINGGGCATISPGGSFTVESSNGSGPVLNMPSAWVGIASAGSSALTIFEFE